MAPRPDGDDRVDLEGLVVGGRRGGRDGQTKFWPFGTATGHDRRLDYSVAKSRVSIVFRENGGPRGRPSCAKDPAVDPAWTPQVTLVKVLVGSGEFWWVLVLDTRLVHKVVLVL